MNIESLDLICWKCSQWFASSTHRVSKLVHDDSSDSEREVYICTCGEDLDDARECHIQTPYDAMMVKVLSIQLAHVNALVEDLESKIEEYGGDQT